MTEVVSYPLGALTFERSAPLGEGGSGEVYRCTTPEGDDMVLKLYDADVAGGLDIDALRALIDWPAQLDDASRAHLTELCAWPRATVVDSGALVGVLTAEAPERFFRVDRDEDVVPRHLSLLAVREVRAVRLRFEYYDMAQKIARLGALLDGLLSLHDYGVVVGDLQWNTVLTTAASDDVVSADVHFVGCDSFLVHGGAVVPTAQSPAWSTGFSGTRFSPETDRFRFALMAIRCLAEQTNLESHGFAQCQGLLPDDEFEVVSDLLVNPSPNSTPRQLKALARAWQLSDRSVDVAPPPRPVPVPPAPRTPLPTGPYVFVSYSTEDSAIALQVCTALEGQGVRCWIAPRDLVAGIGYPEQIVHAIDGALGMIVLISDTANTSKHVGREVLRADNKGLWLIPLRVEPVVPSGALAYYFSDSHWFDAYAPPLAGHLERLVALVRARVPGSDSEG